jgi:hypothetical protein
MIQIVQAPGTWKDWSSSITVGGTSQLAVPANPVGADPGKRKRLIIMNPIDAASQGIGTAEKLLINFTSAASATVPGSISLAPGGSYDDNGSGVSGEAITVVAATTGHIYMAKELV